MVQKANSRILRGILLPLLLAGGGAGGGCFQSPLGSPPFSLRTPLPSSFKGRSEQLQKRAHLAEVLLGIPERVFWCFSAQDQWLQSGQEKGSDPRFFWMFQEVALDAGVFDPRVSSFLAALEHQEGQPLSSWRQTAGEEGRVFDLSLRRLLFYNHRFHQLRLTFEHEKRGVSSEVLWLYAFFSYQYGHRAVLTLLQQALLREGSAGLGEGFLTHLDQARYVLKERPLLHSILYRSNGHNRKEGWVQRFQFFSTCLWAQEEGE